MPAKKAASTKKKSGGRARSAPARDNAGGGGRGGRARQSDREQVPVRFDTVGTPVRIMRANSETNFVEIARKQVVEVDSDEIQREFVSLSAGWYRRDDDDNITDDAGYNKGGLTFVPDQVGEVMDALWSQLDEEEQEEQEPEEED